MLDKSLNWIEVGLDRTFSRSSRHELCKFGYIKVGWRHKPETMGREFGNWNSFCARSSALDRTWLEYICRLSWGQQLLATAEMTTDRCTTRRGGGDTKRKPVECHPKMLCPEISLIYQPVVCSLYAVNNKTARPALFLSLRYAHTRRTFPPSLNNNKQQRGLLC